MRRLEYSHGAPTDERCLMLLCNEDGSVHHFYEGLRAFRRIERQGEWWLLAGRDRETRELIYLREMQEESSVGADRGPEAIPDERDPSEGGAPAVNSALGWASNSEDTAWA